MSDNIDKLNEIIDNNLILFNKAKEIMKEYQDAIDGIMESTCMQDVKEAISNGNPEEIFNNIEEFANKATKERMTKYANEFYKEELERVFDKYNEEEYDKIEFNMRCEILTGLKDALEKCNPDKDVLK